MQLEVCEWREAQMNSVAEILMPGELVMNLELLSAYIHWAYVHVHLLVHIVSACEEINSLLGQVAGEGVVSQLTTSKVCAAIKGYKSKALFLEFSISRRGGEYKNAGY